MGSTGDRVAARERGWQKATRQAGTAVRERERAARRFVAARAQRDAAEQVMAAELERLSTSEGSVPRAAELVGVDLVEAERLMSARQIVRAVPESDDSTSS
ncbi:hypothetical protein CH294_26780 [Rhodococcus sp. 14-2483-1-1]|uniref:hypothetical protein n=1 Tax=unclassified Rhodococcus (in: high G+C Gram-positive bacteria) TaxID=192944 RepID=UPI000B9C1550|nr:MULTISPECIES: hypothetical protein [unclassified Rhodococcus (in: high G+C Gram-positive bacteria)]KAA0922039.1 hypothetical protein FQ188_22240 [Rhodococcus sp. ANT_H53B]OZC69782.1 hypothetical protein CH276_02640 [Rhodococcus sp. 06-470-2]OZD01939.1 hypothetical protein CH275_17830 [Rhodococcus sp. 06-235-1A]OZD67411.1 hypothetical protein CH271_14165 [Rhodococcus sp. 05-340-2]OZD71860.1 hypothetical protein CH272_23495 [Rhodococcus sp. 05-340-1]